MLTASLNVDRCREATVQMAARHLADAAVLVAAAGRARRLPVFSSGMGGAVEQCSVDADPATVAGLSEALHGFPPVSSGWIDPASVPDWLVPQTFSGEVGSAAIMTLPGHGVSAGALVLLRHADRPVFSEDEEMFARLFAARAGAALSAARLHAEQAAITRTLMRDLLPPPLHGLHGIEYAGGYRASNDYEVVGGDFFGDQRLADALTPCAGMPAEAVVERVLMLTAQWVGYCAHDDIAVVAITAPRRTHLSAVDGHTRGRYIA
ncbi:hypothetical protein [Mycobacterium sp. 050134]|uniref:hypothetical protein n=1 Tax=Mycobacterium sp. 050134 TaxID=3096111 RepID=UPI003FA53AAD